MAMLVSYGCLVVETGSLFILLSFLAVYGWERFS